MRSRRSRRGSRPAGSERGRRRRTGGGAGAEYAPAGLWLDAPLHALGAGAQALAQCGLLRVQAVLDVARPAAQHPEARAQHGGGGAHPQMGADAAGVGEGEEGVVVGLRGWTADVGLGVDGDDRAEQGQRLVDEVAAEVVEEPAQLRRVAGLAPAALGLRAPALEAGLEALDVTERAVVDQLADGAEVVVPAAVLEDGEQQAAVLGERGELLGLGGGRGQRLVDDHRQTGLQRGGGERHMGLVRRRQHEQIEVGGAVQHRLRGVDRTDLGCSARACACRCGSEVETRSSRRPSVAAIRGRGRPSRPGRNR